MNSLDRKFAVFAADVMIFLGVFSAVVLFATQEPWLLPWPFLFLGLAIYILRQLEKNDGRGSR